MVYLFVMVSKPEYFAKTEYICVYIYIINIYIFHKPNFLSKTDINYF